MRACVYVPDMIGMLSSCCSHEHAPEEWNIALVFPVLHEERQNSENYRVCKLGECYIQKMYAKNVCQLKTKMGLGNGSHVRILPSFFITN